MKLKILRAGANPIDMNVVRERPGAAEPVRTARGRLAIRRCASSTGAAEAVRGEIDVLKRDGVRRSCSTLRSLRLRPGRRRGQGRELFLKGGVVTKLSGRKVAEQVLNADPSRSLWDKPLAVLVDTGTAGPGEIVAAAMLDAGRGPIVGEHVRARAGFSRFRFPEGGMVLTVAKYMTPKGNPTRAQHRPHDPIGRADGEAAAGTAPTRSSRGARGASEKFASTNGTSRGRLTRGPTPQTNSFGIIVAITLRSSRVATTGEGYRRHRSAQRRPTRFHTPHQGLVGRRIWAISGRTAIPMLSPSGTLGYEVGTWGSPP